MLTIFFHAKAKRDGMVISTQSWCQSCQRQEARIRQGVARRGKPYEKRSPSKLGLKSDANGYVIETEEDRAVYNAYQRELYAKLSEQRRADRREYSRIYTKDRRRARGAKPRKGHYKIDDGYQTPTTEAHKDLQVSCEPVRRLVSEVASRIDFIKVAMVSKTPANGGESLNLQALLDYIGINRSQYYRIMNHATISMITVDNIYTHLGLAYRFTRDYPDL